jgi:hypothetical protein
MLVRITLSANAPAPLTAAPKAPLTLAASDAAAAIAVMVELDDALAVTAAPGEFSVEARTAARTVPPIWLPATEG